MKKKKRKEGTQKQTITNEKLLLLLGLSILSGRKFYVFLNFLLGKKEHDTQTFIFYAEPESLCECSQLKILEIRYCRIKDANIASHFCKHGIPRHEKDTGEDCLEQCSKYLKGNQ